MSEFKSNWIAFDLKNMVVFEWSVDGGEAQWYWNLEKLINLVFFLLNYSNLFNSIYVNYTKNLLDLNREKWWSKNSNYDLQSDGILCGLINYFLEVLFGGTFFRGTFELDLKDTWIRITHNEQKKNS